MCGTSSVCSIGCSRTHAEKREGGSLAHDDIAPLLERLDAQIAAALTQLRATDSALLGEFRGVGRAQLPSTVIGCLVHGAEHSMRHVGQLSVTARIVCGNRVGA
jgi:uncharacterized damage-inducible protein DinB